MFTGNASGSRNTVTTAAPTLLHPVHVAPRSFPACIRLPLPRTLLEIMVYSRNALYASPVQEHAFKPNLRLSGFPIDALMSATCIILMIVMAKSAVHNATSHATKVFFCSILQVRREILGCSTHTMAHGQGYSNISLTGQACFAKVSWQVTR